MGGSWRGSSSGLSQTAGFGRPGNPSGLPLERRRLTHSTSGQLSLEIATAVLDPTRELEDLPFGLAAARWAQRGRIMARRVADQLAQTLEAAGIERVWEHRGVAQRLHRGSANDSDPLDACAPRGGGRVRRRRRGADDRQARRLCRRLRARQPAPDQRPVRLPSQPGSGAGDRRPDPQPGDRRRLFPGNSSGNPCSGNAATTASSFRAAQMPRVLEIAMRTAIERGGVAVVVLPGDVGLREAESNQAARWTAVLAPTVLPPATEIDRLAQLLNGTERVTLLCGAGCAGARDRFSSWPTR